MKSNIPELVSNETGTEAQPGLTLEPIWFPGCGLCPPGRIQRSGLHPPFWVSPDPRGLSMEHRLSVSAGGASLTPPLQPWALPSRPPAPDSHLPPPAGPGPGTAEPLRSVYLMTPPLPRCEGGDASLI